MTASIAGIWPKTLFMPRWPAKQEWPWDAGMDIVHVPIGVAVAGRKQVDPKGDLWHSLIEATGQSPKYF